MALFPISPISIDGFFNYSKIINEEICCFVPMNSSIDNIIHFLIQIAIIERIFLAKQTWNPLLFGLSLSMREKRDQLQQS